MSKADIPEIKRGEHNSIAKAQDTVMWGWDSNNLVYRKIVVDSSGKVKINYV